MALDDLTLDIGLPEPDRAVPANRVHRRGLRTSALVMVVLLLSAELLLRVVPIGRIAPGQWPSAEYPRKVADMSSRAVTDQGGVVLVGSSVVDAGIDPVALDRLTGATARSYNAALLGGSARIVDSWTRDVVVPRLHPKVVVLGVSSRDVSAGNPELTNIERSYDESPSVRHLLGHESLVDELERKAADWSYLVRYRDTLRHPVSAIRGDEPAQLFSGSKPGPQGFELSFADKQYTAPRSRLADLHDRILAHFDPTGREMDAIGSLVRWLVDHHVRVLVVNVPVNDDYVAAHPHGRADYDRYTQLLASVTAHAGGEFLDGGTWDRTLFAEPAHLDGAGAARLTQLVAARLSATAPPATAPPATASPATGPAVGGQGSPASG